MLEYLGHRNVELVTIVDCARLDLRQVHIVLIQVQMLKSGYLNFHMLDRWSDGLFLGWSC